MAVTAAFGPSPPTLLTQPAPQTSGTPVRACVPGVDVTYACGAGGALERAASPRARYLLLATGARLGGPASRGLTLPAPADGLRPGGLRVSHHTRCLGQTRPHHPHCLPPKANLTCANHPVPLAAKGCARQASQDRSPNRQPTPRPGMPPATCTREICPASLGRRHRRVRVARDPVTARATCIRRGAPDRQSGATPAGARGPGYRRQRRAGSTMMRSSAGSGSPRPSLLLVLIHSEPSGAGVAARMRPYSPSK